MSLYVWLRQDGSEWLATAYYGGVALSDARDVDPNTAQHMARQRALSRQEMH